MGPVGSVDPAGASGQDAPGAAALISMTTVQLSEAGPPRKTMRPGSRRVTSSSTIDATVRPCARTSGWPRAAPTRASGKFEPHATYSVLTLGGVPGYVSWEMATAVA